jgi:hypothetical protein
VDKFSYEIKTPLPVFVHIPLPTFKTNERFSPNVVESYAGESQHNASAIHFLHMVIITRRV